MKSASASVSQLIKKAKAHLPLTDRLTSVRRHVPADLEEVTSHLTEAVTTLIIRVVHNKVAVVIKTGAPLVRDKEIISREVVAVAIAFSHNVRVHNKVVTDQAVDTGM